VPADALWGAQTQRAVENYPVSGLREHPTFVRAFIYLKKAAALANKELKALEPVIADAIAAACDELLNNETKYRTNFSRRFSGGWHPFNMNCNEVIANIANRALTRKSASTSRSIPTITSTRRSRRTMSS
jgi:aspartate ammonia-lyase